MGDFDQTQEAALSDSGERNSQDYKLDFSEDEEDLIARMYNLIGERWPLIAGRIPGRSAEEIERYYTSTYFSASK